MTTDYKDRSAGLICFGILLIVMGLLCVLLAAFSGFSMWMTMKVGGGASPYIRPMMLAVVVGMYTSLAVILVWLGIGSLLYRRWAAALVHVLSLLSLISGSLGLVAAGMAMAPMRDSLAGTGGSATFVTLTLIFTLLFMVFVYVIIPGALWLFYRSPHVHATCAARDPRERWTDRCPRPVLLAVVAMSVFGVNTINTLAYPVAPFFGRLLTGGTAVALQAGGGALLMVGALLLYRLRMAGWWIASLVLLFWTVSVLVTFQMVEPRAWFDAMGVSMDARAQPFMTMGFGRQSGAVTAIWACVAGGFLLYLKKYLTPPRDAEVSAT